MTFDKFDNNKKRLLEMLLHSKGIISTACASANLDRQTFYNYKRDDPDFAAAVEEIEESAIDFVESKLLEKINGWENAVLTKEGYVAYDQPPSDTAIIFYLKTKGKKRGYVERQEITGKDGESLMPEAMTVKIIKPDGA